MQKKLFGTLVLLLFVQQSLFATNQDSSKTTTFAYTRTPGTSAALSAVSLFGGVLSAAWSWDILASNPENKYLGCSLAALGALSLLYASKETYRFFNSAQSTPVIELTTAGFTLHNNEQKTIYWDEIDTFDISGTNFIFLLKTGTFYTLESSELDIPLQKLYIAVQQYFRTYSNSSPN